MRSRNVLLFAVVVLTLVCVNLTIAEPNVPGFAITTYASIHWPGMLSFDPSGFLFVGNGVNATSVQIYRIAPGGSPITPYGSTLWDPDAVIYDSCERTWTTPAGSLTTPAGTVLVGGGIITPAYISAILPDESVVPVFDSGVSFRNPSHMIFDTTGRLLFVDPTARGVFQTSGENPTLLFSTPVPCYNIAISANGRVFVSDNAATTTGTIYIYENDTLQEFATGLASSPRNIPMEFGPGGIWGTDLYAIGNENLVRFDSPGAQTVIGTGLDADYTSIVFGPDDALYLSDFYGDSILRIAPEPPIGALIDIDPDTLNKKSHGRWVTVYITLPDGYDVGAIDTSSVAITSLVGESCVPEYSQGADLSFVPQVGDRDEDGIADLTVKFDRQVLLPNLCGDDVGVMIEGELTTGEHFSGSDTIRIIDRGK